MNPVLTDVVVAILIVALGLVIAFVLRSLTATGLRLLAPIVTTQLRRWLGAGDAGRGAGTLGTAATSLLSAAVFWAVFVLFLFIAADRSGIALGSIWAEALAAYFPRLAATVLIVLIGTVLARVLRDAVGATAAAGTAARSIGRIVEIVVLAITGVVAIDQLGVNTTFVIVVVAVVLAAALGAAALAFALGARTAVSNIIGSYYVGKTYRVGQRVRIGEHEGVIAEILPTAVVIETRAGRALVPAREFGEQVSIAVDER